MPISVSIPHKGMCGQDTCPCFLRGLIIDLSMIWSFIGIYTSYLFWSLIIGLRLSSLIWAYLMGQSVITSSLRIGERRLELWGEVCGSAYGKRRNWWANWWAKWRFNVSIGKRILPELVRDLSRCIPHTTHVNEHIFKQHKAWPDTELISNQFRGSLGYFTSIFDATHPFQ